jgi:hypothetical protein
MKGWQKDLIAMGVVILLVVVVALVFYPYTKRSNQAEPIITLGETPTTPSTTNTCIDGEKQDATCPDGVTTYLNENCVDGKWHQVVYIRNPCEPVPTTTTTTTTASTTTTTQPPTPKPTLEVVEETILESPTHKFWIGGKIKNNGDVELFNAQVRLTIFDRFERVLDVTNSPPIAKIGPGATAEFNVIKSDILKKNVHTYNLTAYADETPY